MKQKTKNNAFMYIVFAFACLMLSVTITLALLTDSENNRKTFDFGKIEIGTHNLFVALNDGVANNTKILGNMDENEEIENKLTFSKEQFSSPIYARFKVELVSPNDAINDVISELNTLNFVPYDTPSETPFKTKVVNNDMVLNM